MSALRQEMIMMIRHLSFIQKNDIIIQAWLSESCLIKL